MKHLIAILLLVTVVVKNSGAEELKYSTAAIPWKESLGNHRAVIRVPENSGSVFLRLEWRRHDKDPDLHRFIIVNAHTGQEAQNIYRYDVSNEFCEIAFGPAAAGTSRWYNYYIEGLKWMIKKYDIDGLYLDDVAFDRDMLKRMRKVMEESKPGCLIDLHSNTAFSIGPAIQYTGFFPYIDKLWFGEGFHYNTLTPSQWLVEVSGIPFGLMNDMLGVAGNSPWKGMVYGMTTRYPWGTVKVACNSYDVWKVWDSFGISNAKMIGYWDKDPVVTISEPEVLATAYLKHKKMLVSVASWSEKPVEAMLKIDYSRAGIDHARVKITAPAIPDFQDERTFTPGLPVPMEPSKGWLLVIEENE